MKKGVNRKQKKRNILQPCLCKGKRRGAKTLSRWTPILSGRDVRVDLWGGDNEPGHKCPARVYQTGQKLTETVSWVDELKNKLLELHSGFPLT